MLKIVCVCVCVQYEVNIRVVSRIEKSKDTAQKQHNTPSRQKLTNDMDWFWFGIYFDKCWQCNEQSFCCMSS